MFVPFLLAQKRNTKKDTRAPLSRTKCGKPVLLEAAGIVKTRPAKAWLKQFTILFSIFCGARQRDNGVLYYNLPSCFSCFLITCSTHFCCSKQQRNENNISLAFEFPASTRKAPTFFKAGAFYKRIRRRPGPTQVSMQYHRRWRAVAVEPGGGSGCFKQVILYDITTSLFSFILLAQNEQKRAPVSRVSHCVRDFLRSSNLPGF